MHQQDPALPLRPSVRRELALEKPRRRRSGLLRLAAVTALFWGLGSGPAAAQAPYQMEVIPGFSSLGADELSKPGLADFDLDGDLDMIAGEASGRLRFFENIGSASMAAFVERTGSASPVDGFDVGMRSRPEIVDLDDDLDLDLVVGNGDGLLLYFENTGTSADPAFIERTGTANPLNGIDVGVSADPGLADLDGDGDPDMFVGESGGRFSYFLNTGSTAPAFLQRTGSSNPLNGVDVGSASSPELVDLDGDSDFDVVVGALSGTVAYFRNTGGSSVPAFLEITSGSPFGATDVGQNSTPGLGDLDGDLDFDAVLGESNGALLYFRNTGASTAPNFIAATGTGNPTNGFDVAQFSSPDLPDLDGDGDLDAVIGGMNGQVSYYQNTGSSATPAYLRRTGAANPFNGFDVGDESNADQVDLDGDGDLDAIIGGFDGMVRYFANTGSSTAPAFLARTGTLNPFDGIDVTEFAAPELVDLDGDGDLDAIIGSHYGPIFYFENTGSSTAPVFLARTGTLNPFDAMPIVGHATPELVDLDGDGDRDMVTGQYEGDLLYFENTGTTAAPVFLQRTGTDNPFNGIDVARFSTPELVDLDGDTDFDMLVGGNGGRGVFFRSLAPKNLSVTKDGSGDGTVTSDLVGINCGVDCSEGFAEGATVTLTATPAVSSTFTAWAGSGCSGTGTCVVTMTVPRAVTATFTINSYLLTVSKNGTGTGTVTSDVAGINCGGDCSESYTHGAAVTLTATADGGSAFSGWSGGGCSGTGTCVVAMTEVRNVTATFDIATFALNVAKTGDGSGTVTSSPVGIDCGSDCTETYTTGTMVTLTAAAGVGSFFNGWSGEGCSGTGTCIVSMTVARSVTASFLLEVIFEDGFESGNTSAWSSTVP